MSHEPFVTQARRRASPYLPCCSCGWRGERKATHALALLVAEEHVELAEEGP